MQATLAVPAAAEFAPLIPELVLVGAAFALLMLDLFLSERQRVVTHLLGVAALVLVAVLVGTGVGGGDANVLTACSCGTAWPTCSRSGSA